MNNDSGILIINKPAGWTSARVVAHLKKILTCKKIGHCGTLDPRATGVLVVCFGKATRLSSQIMDMGKVYHGVFRLGMTTDTGDLDGAVTGSFEGELPAQRRIEEVFNTFTGQISQIPPMYSALKIKGKKLYELARKGIVVERPPRTVTIHRFSLVSYAPPDVTFDVSCSRGTYVRTLAEDIGNTLGTGAVLTSLQRTAVGEYHVNDALNWDEASSMRAEQMFGRAIPLERVTSKVNGNGQGNGDGNDAEKVTSNVTFNDDGDVTLTE